MTITGAGTNIRPLAPGQRARLLVGDIDGAEPRLVYETTGSALVIAIMSSLSGVPGSETPEGAACGPSR